jgi:hypothetical protein
LKFKKRKTVRSEHISEVQADERDEDVLWAPEHVDLWWWWWITEDPYIMIGTKTYSGHQSYGFMLRCRRRTMTKAGEKQRKDAT